MAPLLHRAAINRHRASTSTCWHFVLGLCCHSDETHAPIANPPNSAHPEAPSTPGPCSSVGIQKGSDTDTDRHTDSHDHFTFRLGVSCKMQLGSTWQNANRCQRVHTSVLPYGNQQSVITSMWQVHRPNFPTLHCNWFPNFTSHFTSIDYWTICKYYEISRIS